MIYQIEQRNSDLSAGRINSLTTWPHIHPHLEIIYLTQGASLAYADNRCFSIGAGDLYISFPNQIHYYHVQSDINGYLLIFSPDLIREFETVFEKQVPTNAVLNTDLLPEDIHQQIEKLLCIYESSLPLKNLIVQGLLTAILAAIVPNIPLMDVTANQDTVKTLLTYCIENYNEPITLDTVSEHLHLSKYYICHIFKERMGVGFAEFINSLRISDACRALKQGSSITEAAYNAGFSSIRTFNRVFMKSMGMPPSAYAASQK